MNKKLWDRYKQYLYADQSLGFMLDISRMSFSADFFTRMETEIQKAYAEMDNLESGAIANPDERRMVGHYWLRNPDKAPSQKLREEIKTTIRSVKKFVSDVHSGKIRPEKGKRFTRILSIGIGGSALGPQFIADALGGTDDQMKSYFLDNSDPNGMDRILKEIGNALEETLTLVISKSGGTAETRNGMIEVAAAYNNVGLKFEKHAVAITGVGSKLDDIAKKGSWITTFPMWDWVGGRTSAMSAVGLLPAMLQGIEMDKVLQGASACDEATRGKTTGSNPAALLALAWYHATNGRGEKDMVILPYKDRLMLFPKYLQQLVMESLGKERDREGKVVHQGIAVYGNKGSTDQHAYVQQLREGVNNFFATFIEVLNDRDTRSPDVEPGVTSGDYLDSFLLGTRNALFENGRESITITIRKFSPEAVGVLIALYERAVGFYATLVNVNAYHQPGVEAGKKMAGTVIKLQNIVLSYLRGSAGKEFTAEEIARAVHAEDSIETIFKILEHASANPDHGVAKSPALLLHESRYRIQ